MKVIIIGGIKGAKEAVEMKEIMLIMDTKLKRMSPNDEVIVYEKVRYRFFIWM